MEALIMSKFQHPNIVHFIGVCFDKHPRYVWKKNSFSDFGCFTKIILYLTMYETYLYLHLVKHSFLFSKVHNSGTFGRGRFEIISERVPFKTSKPSNKTFLIIYVGTQRCHCGLQERPSPLTMRDLLNAAIDVAKVTKLLLQNKEILDVV